MEIIDGLPSIVEETKRANKWPWSKLKVGQSVLLGVEEFKAAVNSLNQYRHRRRTAGQFVNDIRYKKIDVSSWIFQRVA